MNRRRVWAAGGAVFCALCVIVVVREHSAATTQSFPTRLCRMILAELAAGNRPPVGASVAARTCPDPIQYYFGPVAGTDCLSYWELQELGLWTPNDRCDVFRGRLADRLGHPVETCPELCFFWNPRRVRSTVDDRALGSELDDPSANDAGAHNASVPGE